MKESYIFLLFPLAILLHNIEEAIWLPKWSKLTKKYHKPVKADDFRFAVVIVTVLAYLATLLLLIFNDVNLFKYIYFGFLGSMILNAIFPHLVMTIVLKKYAPGLLTGLFINIPFNSYIIYVAVENSYIQMREIIISTVFVGISILLLLPVLFKVSNLLIDYDEK